MNSQANTPGVCKVISIAAALITTCALNLYAATAPPALTKPYPGNLWVLYGTGCAGVNSSAITKIANNLCWVNSHSTAMGAKFWFWDECGGISGGLNIKQQILAKNPNFTFGNYRNGSYTAQGNNNEAGESEQRFPMGIAVWDTGSRPGKQILATDTTLELTRAKTPPSGTADFYPFKASKTTQAYSVDKHNYVAWLRLDNEVIRINTISWNSATSRIVMTVQRGIWGTTAASHATTARVMQPVYIGSVTSGADTQLSGVPDSTNTGNLALRYAYYQDHAGFQTWLGDKCQYYFDHGVDVTWLDVTSSKTYNNGDAYGKVVDPWDYRTNAKMTQGGYTNYQQEKIDALFARFPTKKFFINNVKGPDYFGYEKRFFTGNNSSNQKVHHEVSGGCMEFYVDGTNLYQWKQDINMTLDMVKNNYWTIAWAKGGNATYKLYAYASYLLSYTPGCRVVFGSDFGLTGTPNAFLYYDLGTPLQTFANVDAAVTSVAGVYRRQFNKGTVLVNVNTTSKTIPLPRALYDTDTKTFVDSVTMAGSTGKILLKSVEDLNAGTNESWSQFR